jgi:hypothetical protein
VSSSLRLGLAGLLLAAAGGLAGAEGAPIKIQILRPADKGPISSVPCIITLRGAPKGAATCDDVVRGPGNKTVSGGKTTVLLGGDRVTCTLPPDVTIEAFTPRALRPTEFTPDATTWEAARLSPRGAGPISVTPQAKGRTLLGGWRLEQKGRANK